MIIDTYKLDDTLITIDDDFIPKETDEQEQKIQDMKSVAKDIIQKSDNRKKTEL